ncbi:hypothetical protein MuYL_2977 [Mucilaginibacter xinganensis]|uniref:Uncharacterized protein n=1 Tax=Mucilaginibacter xinganensis TaxID=1234841 RepID=A0A223NYC8_9SPHI|nr:hypothetical protein MuYL_2977 [Mucilaginibacter xinganensis]
MFRVFRVQKWNAGGVNTKNLLVEKLNNYGIKHKQLIEKIKPAQ